MKATRPLRIAQWMAPATLLVAASGQVPVPAGHVQLRVLPRVARDVDALPRVAVNAAVSAPVAAALNRRLAGMDAANARLAGECHRAERKQHGDPGTWTGSVDTTMRGPRYLSLLVVFGGDCGGAHPDQISMGMVYDMTTGPPVDWPALLPGARVAYAMRDGSGMATVAWPVLREAAKMQAEQDCKASFDAPELDFSLWLDGDAGRLMAVASLAHVEAPCEVPVALSVVELRRLGVKADLLDALQAASEDKTPQAMKRRAAARK